MNVANISVNKKRPAIIRVAYIFLILAALMAVLVVCGPQIKNAFHLASNPVEKTFFAAGEASAGYISSLLKAGSLAKENEDLKNENQKLLSQISFLMGTQAGSVALGDALSACKEKGYNLMMAGVIGLDEQDMLSINKGSADGVQEGMPVINQQNVLYGKVSKVYKNFSKVLLISNKNSLIDVRIQSNDSEKEPVYGAIKGSGGLGVYLDLVPVDEEISENSVLFTSALEGTFPKDLLIGIITKKEKDDQKPFQQAQIKPFFNLKNCDNLFIITNYKTDK